LQNNTDICDFFASPNIKKQANLQFPHQNGSERGQCCKKYIECMKRKCSKNWQNIKIHNL